MSQKNFACAIARIGLLVALPIISGATDLHSNFETRVLAAHNRERSNLGLEQLAWSDELARSAAGWADELARTGRFEHAPENHIEPEGENLWAGTVGRYSYDEMVAGWLAEKRNFRMATFPNNSITGDVRDVGHYTQIVWRDTLLVGCAVARGKVEDVLVCRYSQAGNYIGEKPY